MLSVNPLLTLFQHLIVIASWIPSVAVGIFCIGFLIGFHELGHFLFAKLFNVRTPSFSIGFGPRILTKKIGETEFSLSAIPLGGYVELAGAAEIGQGEQKEALSTDPHSFAQKPYYQKLLVLSGGILFNLLFAYLAAFFIFFLGADRSPYLYPFNATAQIETVVKGSDIEQAGLRSGDTLVSIVDSTPTPQSPTDFLKKLLSMPIGTRFALIVQRDGHMLPIQAVRAENLGFQLKTEALAPTGAIDAVKKACGLVNLYVTSTFVSFKRLFQHQSTAGMAGPITIISEATKKASLGFKTMLLFMALISVNLAILNLIPLPILDGGQILFYTLESLFSRKLPVRVKEVIFITNWVLFLILLLYISLKDLILLFSRKA